MSLLSVAIIQIKQPSRYVAWICLKRIQSHSLQAIEAGKYNIVIIGPEILMTDTHVQALWKKSKFM